MTLDKLKEKLAMEQNIDINCICCIEEMAEASQVIVKYLRGSHKFTKEKMIEEVSHAMLMLDVVRLYFGITDEQMANEQLEALARLGGDYAKGSQVQ